MTRGLGRLAIGLFIVAAPSTALANWDEAVNGDLSTNPNSPTPVAFVPGSNIVTGTVTSGPARTHATT